MILLLLASLLQPPTPADITCPAGAVLVVRVHPEYKYQCAWPEQLTDAIEPNVTLPQGAVPMGMRGNQ